MVKKAVIFDLDGTLIDSIPFHFGEHKVIFNKFGVNLNHHFFQKYCNGTKPNEFYKIILKHYKRDLKLYKKAVIEKEKVFANESYEGINTFPYVKMLLFLLKKSGYKLAIASSSGIVYINKNLKNNKIDKYFKIKVGSSSTKHSKPNPYIFNCAWKKLGVKKSECVVVEDSTNGVIAAKRAKIDCICLLTSEKKKDIPKSALIAKNHMEIYRIIKKM
jgi:beta-phosphoglucomutase